MQMTGLYYAQTEEATESLNRRSTLSGLWQWRMTEQKLDEAQESVPSNAELFFHRNEILRSHRGPGIHEITHLFLSFSVKSKTSMRTPMSLENRLTYPFPAIPSLCDLLSSRQSHQGSRSPSQNNLLPPPPFSAGNPGVSFAIAIHTCLQPLPSLFLLSSPVVAQQASQ